MSNRYPHGKLNDDDEGELRVAIGHERGNVILDFYKPVKWIGLPPEQAMGLARLLVHHALAIHAGAPDAPVPVGGVQ